MRRVRMTMLAGLIMAAFAAPAQAQDAGSNLAELKKLYERPLSIPAPEDNPITPEKVELGKMLFFDPRLSKTSSMSCATCHNPSFGWGDGLPKGIGFEMKQLGRKSPTVLNLAWSEIMMWDGRAASLEDQALGPIEASVEMNQSIDETIAKLNLIPVYRSTFESVFPEDGLTAKNMAKAIATYERTIISNDAPFDAWIRGNEDAISEEAKQGFALFNGKANCAACHSGWNFTDDSFHDIGIADHDLGRGKILPGIKSMEYAFKTPGLREISSRAPYMHDGSQRTLAEVIDHYDRGGIDRPSLSAEIQRLNLSVEEKEQLLAFLKTLDSPPLQVTLPALPTVESN